ncbi:hypothetical protein GCM10020219_002520 [Nonomuraea dietziae]
MTASPVARCPLAPQAVDQLTDPHEAAAVGQQQHQDGLLLRCAEIRSRLTAVETRRSQNGEPAGSRDGVRLSDHDQGRFLARVHGGRPVVRACGGTFQEGRFARTAFASVT